MADKQTERILDERKMKLLGREINFTRMKESFKGMWAKGTTTTQKRKHYYPGEHTWNSRCEYYDTIIERHPLAKSQNLTVAGQITSDGVFVEVAYTEGPHATRSKEALDLIEQLNKKIGIETLIYDTACQMHKYGSSFWEISPEPFDVRLHPYPETIEIRDVDQSLDKILWRQNLSIGGRTIDYSEGELLHFPWSVTSRTWPYGTSLLVGLENEFEILEQLEDDIQQFMKKAAFPYEMWQVGDGQFMPHDAEVEAIKSDVKNMSPGEHIVTSYPIKKETGGTGDKTITGLPEILDFLYNHIIDGGMVPPISKQWNSTNASAEEMMPWARANLIQPMQRIISSVVEEQLYKPYLMLRGFSALVCPRLKWESPDAHKDEEAEYWSMQVQSGIVPPDYAAEAQGFDMDKIRKMREEEQQRQQEMMNEQMQLAKVNPMNKQSPDGDQDVQHSS